MLTGLRVTIRQGLSARLGTSTLMGCLTWLNTHSIWIPQTGALLGCRFRPSKPIPLTGCNILNSPTAASPGLRPSATSFKLLRTASIGRPIRRTINQWAWFLPAMASPSRSQPGFCLRSIPLEEQAVLFGCLSRPRRFAAAIDPWTCPVVTAGMCRSDYTICILQLREIFLMACIHRCRR